MNAQIDKLAEQAGLWNDMEPTRREGRYAGYMNVSDVEKFAELIVRECALAGLESHGNYDVHDDILKHFGVEE